MPSHSSRSGLAEISCDARGTAEENFQLRSQLEWLRAELQKQKPGATSAIARPDQWEELPDWVEKTLHGRLILHPRAINRLKRAVYEDFALVCDALELLAGPYRNNKLLEEGAHAQFEARRQELGLDLSKTIAEHKAGQFGDTYYLRYPLGNPNAPRHFIEWHLKKGKTFNPVYSLRIDFLWHPESRQIIVANLPDHLQLDGSN